MSMNAFLNGVGPYESISEKWAKVLLKNLSLTGIYKHIAMDHSSELADNSDAIHLRIVSDSSVNVGNYYTRNVDGESAGTEGTISYTPAAVNKVTLALTNTPYAAVSFESYALKTADVAFQAKIIDRAKYKIAQAIDTLVMNTILAAVPVANTLTGFNATTAASGEVYDLLLQMAAILKNAGAVPVSNSSDLFGDKGMEEAGYVVVNPDVMRYILKEPSFQKIDFTDKSAMWKDGIVRGTIAGLMVLESSNLPTTSKKVTIFAGIKSAAHFAVKLIADRMIEAEDNFQTLWSTLFAAGCVVSHSAALAKVEVTVAA
ncbi:MAG: hypothetical protein MJ156_00405 [Alphaproteobacteria bacterium]|nr:hypothetical protein [Alphaproteobacteria bacterium]